MHNKKNLTDNSFIFLHLQQNVQIDFACDKFLHLNWHIYIYSLYYMSFFGTDVDTVTSTKY